MINRQDIIKKQLSTEKPIQIVDDGHTITLLPARYVPVLNNPDTHLSINGFWRVKRWPFNTDESTLVSTSCDDTTWDELEQPGKVLYCDPEENPATVKKWNRITLEHIDFDDGAVIRRIVKIPTLWKNKRIYLRFDAIYPAGRVYCNGSFLGEHLSGLTPVEWNVTDFVEPGKAVTVAVRLLRRHKYVQMDMPRHALEFTGLAQDAYFHATEKVYISDYHLVSTLEESLTKGVIEGSISITNNGNKESPCTVTVSLTNPRIDQTAYVEERLNIKPGYKKDVLVKLEIEKPDLWNDEFPNLYDVNISLTVKGQQDQTAAYRTGFRKFILQNQRALLNGNPVKFRGVNHLTYHPEFGMYTPKEWLRRCLTLMKRANVNAIRTHFLPPPALVELCDELGIYLLQELPIDWGQDYVHNPDFLGPAMMRIDGAVRRDRHHVSLMVWSIGNENMPRNMTEHDDFYNHLHIFDELTETLDPTRPTMFPPPGPANKVKGILELRLGDVADTHYSFKLVREFNKTGKVTNPKTWEGDTLTCTRQEAIEQGWSGVWFSSEYGIMNMQPDLLNAPYLSILADTEEDPLSGKNTMQTFIDRLREEWGYMRDDPMCLGGAYFPWLCSGVGNNPWGWVRWGEDADWGVVTADLLPKPAFWAMRVLFSPVWFPEKVIWEDDRKEIEFEILNTYNNIDLKQCTLRTMMGRGGRWMGQMREWKDVSITCAPGKKAKVRIPIWNSNTREDLKNGAPAVCRCILLDPTGYRTITSDIIIVPRKIKKLETVISIGPDAE